MFPTTTYLSVIQYLDKSISDVAEIQDALLVAEAIPEVEAEVIEVLDRIEALNDAIASERASVNSAMIRADVIEWEAGKRSAGMVTAINVLKDYLARLLGLTYKNKTYGACGTFTIPTQTII